MQQGGRIATEGRARFDDPDDPRFMLPDVSYYRAGMLYRVGKIFHPPTIAFEIRSEGQTYAYHRRRAQYFRDHGVEEWIIDPHNRTFEVVDGERDGIVYRGGSVPSVALEGFALNIDELFSDLDGDYA